VDHKPPLESKKPEHDHSSNEGHALGSREFPQPANHAWTCAFSTLPDDEASYDSQNPVARECFPPSRGGVKLAEAMAVGLSTKGEVGRDSSKEQQ
jgi:hypothetical protein